jgi:hypothetical protein
MKITLIILGAITALCVTVIAFIHIVGGNISETGKKEAQWIIHDMWQPPYYNTKKGGLSDVDKNFIQSLMFDSSKSNSLASRISSTQCTEPSPDCYLKSLSKANLLIDGKKLVDGINIATETSLNYKNSTNCPIAYDLTVLKFKIATLSFKKRPEARKTADHLVATIKKHGGLTEDLRTPSCNALAATKPELFHVYVMFVTILLKYGDSNAMKASAYITSRADDSLI